MEIKTEDKIGKCIKRYGDFAFENGCTDDNVWRVLFDLEMFVQVLFIVISGYDEWENETYENILNSLQEKYIKKMPSDGVYSIRRCPPLGVIFPYDPVFLRLAYISFVLEKDKLLLVQRFIEVCYYQAEDIGKQPDYVDRIRELHDELGDGWTKKLLDVYKRHARRELGGGYLVKAFCNRAVQFMKNKLNDDTIPYHPMLN